MKYAVLLLLIVSSPLFCFAQSKTNSADERELTGLIKTWNDAELKGDATTIGSLLADEFSFLGGSNKVEYLRLMKPDTTLVIESANIEGTTVRTYGDAAVVTSSNSYRVKKNGEPFAGKYLLLTVWIKRHGHWQCVEASMQPLSA